MRSFLFRNSLDDFDKTINYFRENLLLDEETKLQYLAITDSIQNALNEDKKGTEYHLYIFGSFVSGLALKDSDIVLFVELERYHSMPSYAQSKEEFEKLNDTLSKKRFIANASTKLTFEIISHKKIDHSRVPIIKLEVS